MSRRRERAGAALAVLVLMQYACGVAHAAAAAARDGPSLQPGGAPLPESPVTPPSSPVPGPAADGTTPPLALPGNEPQMGPGGAPPPPPGAPRHRGTHNQPQNGNDGSPTPPPPPPTPPPTEEPEEKFTDDLQLPTWTEPRQFTRAELAQVAGKPEAQFSMMDIIVLETTNHEILEKGVSPQGLTLLQNNYRLAQQNAAKMATEQEAKVLDAQPAHLAPLEKAALEETNRFRLLGFGDDAEFASLRKNFERLLSEYSKSPQLMADAEALFKAMRGAGTDEDAIYKVLEGRTTNEITMLRGAFKRYCTGKPGAVYGTYSANDCDLDTWLNGELSNGHKEKVLDLLAGKPPKPDEEYFYVSYVAKRFNNLVRSSYSNAEDMIKYGSTVERWLGYYSKAVFDAAGGVNDAVKVAQEYYTRKLQSSTSSVGKGFWITCFTLASIGGAFGTKALDPRSTVAEVEEGLFDLALTLGSAGVGKLVQGAAKTRLGIAALKQMSRAFHAVHRGLFAAKKLVGIAPTVAKLEQKAAKLTSIAAKARAAGHVDRADRAAKAAQEYSKASKALADAEKTAKAAIDLTEQAKTLAREGTRVEEAVAMQQKAAEEIVKSKAALDKALEAHGAAKSLAFQQATLAVPGVARTERALRVVKNFFLTDLNAVVRARNARRASANVALLGNSNDLVRAKALPSAQVAADDALVAAGKKPDWATLNHGGVQGAGMHADEFARQSQFWDDTSKCWRNGPGSLGTAGERTGKSLAGEVVELSDSGVAFDAGKSSWAGPSGVVDQPQAFKGVTFQLEDGREVFRGPGAPNGLIFDKDAGRWTTTAGEAVEQLPEWATSLRWNKKKKVYDQLVPAVDLCKVNPTFCTGPKGIFCKNFPALCNKVGAGNLRGRPRTTMPQVEDMKKFLDYIERETGRRPGVTRKVINPDELSITQAEINLHKTSTIGDGIAEGTGWRPPATLVGKDNWIIDGHHVSREAGVRTRERGARVAFGVIRCAFANTRACPRSAGPPTSSPRTRARRYRCRLMCWT